VQLTGILHKAGAPILLGTDTPNPFVVPGFSIHDELRNLVNAGMSPYEALRCGTIDAARFVGESDRWGTVQTGRRADLLLLRQDPLVSGEALRQLEAVFVNGFMLSSGELDRLLAERQEAIRPTAR
jgi:imidazolonepropionase-like amidohydrolase